jgi:lipid-binding SYLF domain-containing protein
MYGKSNQNRALAVYAVLQALTLGGIAIISPGCATAPQSAEGKAEIETRAGAAVARAKTSDPTLVPVFKDAVGYAVFPSVGKGGIGIGGAYGRGVLFEGGTAVGYCDLTQATIGFQLGGQEYTEILAFSTQGAIQSFKTGKMSFNAEASAVAVKSGSGANAKFAEGVAVFTLDEAGLMYEASIGGQKFTYQNK